MKKRDVQIGNTYIAKLSGVLAKVHITRESLNGGWYGTNLATGREVRIRGLPAGFGNSVLMRPALQ